MSPPTWLSDVARRRKALIVILVVVVAGLPHLLSGVGWYPADTDDTLQYLFRTSRLLAWDGFLASPFGPARSGYGSVYFVVMAILSRLTTLHPMDLYRISGYVGAFAIPASVGGFIFLATGRWRISVIGIFIAGLWGGLAGYHWLFRDALPAIRSDLPLPLMTTDYSTPRHFGEYRGMNSPLTSYLSDVPFYPREVALCLFWVGLGIISTARKLRHDVIGGAGIIGSILVYPYHLVPAFLVGFALLIDRGRKLLSRPRSLLLLAGSIALISALLLVTVAHAYRLHYGDSLFERVQSRRTTPLVLPEQFHFRPGTLISEYFFFLLVIAVGAFVWRRRVSRAHTDAVTEPNAGRQDSISGLFMAPLAVSVGATCLLSETSVVYRAATGYYGFTVPWRAIATPLFVLAAASSLDVLLEAALAGRGRRVLLGLTLLLPIFSPMHWTINAAIFQQKAVTAHWVFRSSGYELYDEFTAYGSEILGTVALREPVVVTGCPVAVSGFAQAAFGVRCVPSRIAGAEEGQNLFDPLFTVAGRDELNRQWASSEIGDVLTVQTAAFARRTLADGTCTAVVRFGPYVILRARSAAAE